MHIGIRRRSPSWLAPLLRPHHEERAQGRLVEGGTYPPLTASCGAPIYRPRGSHVLVCYGGCQPDATRRTWDGRGSYHREIEGMSVKRRPSPEQQSPDRNHSMMQVCGATYDRAGASGIIAVLTHLEDDTRTASRAAPHRPMGPGNRFPKRLTVPRKMGTAAGTVVTADGEVRGVTEPFPCGPRRQPLDDHCH